jgi:Holliday junction resolvase-like predicted endonuclease
MSAITYEHILELFRQSQERFDQDLQKSREEFDKRMKESELAWEKLHKKSQEKFDKMFARIGDRIGELIESMVEGGIVRLFQAQGYAFTRCSRRMEFENKQFNVSGEIDLFLENGDFACLVEVKTNLSADDVRDHIERLQRFRIDADARGDKRQFIAAVGGGVVLTEVQQFALKQGFFIIKQSGENVEIVPPDGKPKTW